MRVKHVLICPLIALSLISCADGVKNKDLTNYVDPFIGTADNGHTFPGATSPFGMIQASPQTGNDGWKYCSGFNYSDDTIIGFAQTHLNGTGGPDLGDILLFPFTRLNGEDKYLSAFDKERQKASAGYYSVYLTDARVYAEMVTTPRTAFYKFTYSGEEIPQLLVDLQNGITGWGKTVQDHVLEAELKIVGNQMLLGHNEVEAWVKRKYFFAIELSAPFGEKRVVPRQEKERADRLVLQFPSLEKRELYVKVGLSTVSTDGALKAISEENPDWDFDAVRTENQTAWNKLLSRVEAEGPEEDKTNFYTSLYHLFIQPNNIADTDGKYRGVDDQVCQAADNEYYSTFSLWDTYRASHPLYTILTPERVNGFVRSMIAHYKAQGYLPIWTVWGKENHCMIGNHAIPVIVDAYLKGFRDYDVEKAYEAIKVSSTENHFNSSWDIYNKFGYYPFDLIEVESVSRTLESNFDDFCVAQMAKAMGKMGDYNSFSERAGFFKNLFDPESKLMRGRDSGGEWRTPFNSLRLSHASTAGGDYTEGNAWQYTWHVQHDIEGLISLMGGKGLFASKLDSLFFLAPDKMNSGFTADVTGLIGQYAHGNEPSHHVAYLYQYVDQPWKTESLIREIFDRFYLPKPDGLCGNDDCGQMSAWYIFSAMGFYPVNPVGQEYVVGAPQLPKITLHLENNKTFSVVAKNLSKENKYVKSITLNGIKLKGFTLSHQDIMDGGELIFEMSNEIHNRK
ncbi:MAG: GH92 family glycosyl hydrolase [Proteiniphilum sp.]|nr:GH92 family glycosyl hydrolase [Proteiniphilum sp.]MDD4416347.1 GH92 family glycosyl hydrolase [Proteiniphilum sp.]